MLRSLAVRMGEECHTNLRGFRGTLGSLDSLTASDDSLMWLGAGDVGGLFLHKPSR